MSYDATNSLKSPTINHREWTEKEKKEMREMTHAIAGFPLPHICLQ